MEYGLMDHVWLAEKMQVPFDSAQGRHSTPLKNASLRMTVLFLP